MDHLSYDLVEEVASYLPRPELETIARVASRSPRLQNWSMASEDQLEHRFLLDVHVHLQGFQNEAETIPRIRLSARKRLSEETLKEWDFKNWRYAWIEHVSIEASLRDSPRMMHAPRKEEFKESDIHQVLRVVSLPVDRTARTFFWITYDCVSTPRELADLLRKTIDATQKDFVSVRVDNERDHALGGFIADTIKRGALLQNLYYYGHSVPQRNVYEAIAPLFRKTRRRPLLLSFHHVHFQVDGIALIADAWLESDGAVEDITVEWNGWAHREEVWSALKQKYKTIVDEPYGGYLAHPTRRSTLFIAPNKIRTMEFKPWHVPVDFEWIDALIAKWRAGWGFYAWRTEKTFSFHFKATDDWKNLVKKYGPAVDNGECLPIAHPTGATFLEVEVFGHYFGVTLEHEFFTRQKLKSLISKWKRGNGETLVNGVTKIEVEIGNTEYDDFVTRYHSHPTRNARCLIVQQDMCGDRSLERICIVPIDPEDVEDWNLELLFGSLQV